MSGRTAYEAFYAGLPKDTFDPWDEVRPDSQAIWARIERAVLADGDRLRERLEDAMNSRRVEIAAKLGAHNEIKILVEEVVKLRDALKEEAHWHDRRAKELGKQPPSIDRNWRMNVHRERRDAICPLVGWPEGGPVWGDAERQT